MSPGFQPSSNVVWLGEKYSVGFASLERQNQADVPTFAMPLRQLQAVGRGDEDDLRRLQRGADSERDGVGGDAVGLAVAVEAQRRDDGRDAGGEERLEHLGVHALDLAGEEVVHPLQDAQRRGRSWRGLRGFRA